MNRTSRETLPKQVPPRTLHLNRRSFVSGALLLCACRRRAELPDLGEVPDFTLSDQSQRAVGRSTLKGKVWVAAFMFTRCPTICPRITGRMRQLSEKAKAEDLTLHLVSISVDPENDTPAVLSEYAKRFELDLTRWSFVTGDIEVIRKTAVDGFKLALEGRADAGASDFGIVHGSHLVLVDRAAHIRGYYRTDDDAELERLIEDAKQL
jgi:protein SCO1/2